MKYLHDSNIRDVLLKIFSQSLLAVNGQRCVAEFLTQHPLPAQKVRVIGIGKAAASMMLGALESHAQQIEAGLIITKVGHTEKFAVQFPPILQLESAHPYPDQRSVEAGRQLLHFISQTPRNTGLLFLISGGTSSLVEVLPESIDVEQLHKLNRWLLAQGWPIDVMNQIRKSVSMIKAGRLACSVAEHAVMQLVISDVSGDDLSVIGSGLLTPNVLTRGLPEQLPDWIVHMQGQVPAPPTADAPCFATIQSYIIASNARLREEVVRNSRTLGYSVRCNAELEGEAAQQGAEIAQTLIDGPAGIYLWGGETVVTLPERPGQGGRCQQLALAAAQTLAGHDNMAILAVGTDGNDGPGDVAGAFVDGQTLTRARDAGAQAPEVALRHADAGSFLAASGDLVDTGPTGSNVMDLVIGLKV
jgi:glycerate 2-kinase